MTLQVRPIELMVPLTRASTATYLDADGLIKTAAIDIPRFDWSTGRRALLLEASATNLVPMQQANANGATSSFLGANGVFTNTSIVTAEQTYAAHFAFIPAQVAVVRGQTYTLSMYVAPINNRYLGIIPGSAGFGTGCWAVFDTQTDTFVYQTNCVASFQKIGSIYRLSITVAAIASATTSPGGAVISNGGNERTPSFIPPVGAGLAYYGCQLEVGPTATSYIPTAGSAVTRAADTVVPIDLSGYDLSGGYTVVAWGQLDGVVGAYDRVLQLDNGNEAKRHLAFWDKSLGALVVQAFSDGIQGSFGPTGGPQLGQPFKVAMAASGDYFQAARNGVVSALDTSVAYVTPAVLRLAKGVAGDRSARLLLSRVAIYPKLLAADDLMGVTT